ncbi:MAG: 3-oxoacyl-ACP reductase [Phycisphaeraceae bacterium]|nr:3-oxoacyl-ACP reductase [Phycisphaeraceae bacterium]
MNASAAENAESRKVAIVTGAGTGIGSRTSAALVQAGYAVAMAGRRADMLEAAAAEASPTGERVLVIPTDVRDPDSVDHLFDRTVETFGRLDLLFNNAGISPPGVPTEDLTDEAWRDVIDTNLNGTFYCCRAAVRVMKAQAPRGGRIINNGSVSAQVPRTDSAPYTASKHAITGLTRSMALDGRKHDIACGQIDIGNAESERFGKAKGGLPQPNGAVIAEPAFDVDHVADAVLHMAGLPLSTNVLFMTIMATKMPLVGRG